ncbi:uncharacterized protein LOC120410444 [Corvus cornix cornix]|uniref:uncharacterized protein LOC120410444 n=1 Tax=Corvus cornix cornix TaxID=932674 RepID=UPI0019513A3D|nr:uncharacterized protein LOC120410444 [Corvus cornix cornix]
MSHALESSPLQVPPLALAYRHSPRAFLLAPIPQSRLCTTRHALRSLVSDARHAPVLKPGLSIVFCLRPFTPSWCGCNKPSPMELYTETLPASLPSTDITGAISVFVHAHMCECVLILPSGFAKETLLEDRSTSRYDTEKPQRLESDSGWYSRERDAIQRDMDRLDRALGHGIKGCAAPGSASSSSLVCLSSRNELCLLRGEMSCCRPCPPRPCGPCGPNPLASSCSEPCVARCADSTVSSSLRRWW